MSGPPIGVVGVMLQAVPLVHTTLTGAVYVPAGHPVPDTANCAPVTFALIATEAGFAEKFAVMVDGAFMISDTGFAELTTLPLHPVN